MSAQVSRMERRVSHGQTLNGANRLPPEPARVTRPAEFVDDPTKGRTMGARVTASTVAEQTPPVLRGRASSVEPFVSGGALPPPAFPGSRAEVITPHGSTKRPGHLSPSMGGFEPNAAAAGRPHRAEPAGGKRYSKQRPSIVPSAGAAILIVFLAGWLLLGADVQARITLLAGLLLVAMGAAVLAALHYFPGEDRGRVTPVRSWEER